MHRSTRLALAGLLAWATAFFAPAARAQADYETAPPRLSFVEGEVAFFREGAEDWTAAQVNTALDAGDELYAGADANLEIQIGARAFLRAGEQTRLALRTLEPDFLQLELAEGTLSLDVRDLPAGHTLAIATPNAAFSVEQTGYYRVEVAGEETSFISRRGGHAALTSAAGQVGAIAASEQVVVAGLEAPAIGTYAAPELDDWDRWNYRRTDQQIEALSGRYVPAEVYGVSDLDYHGAWRVVPTYGAVWVPRGVPAGWAPYTVGRWMWDVRFGWTWVDAAPWGWAPFHYGRWVRVHGYWAWAPGPSVVRPVYAPALVAFFGGSVSIGVGVTPALGWVALGWGEPCIPWWGPVGYVGHPRWLGWGGPRVVNKVVIQNTTVVNVTQIREYQHRHARGAAVFVRRDRFGRVPVQEARIESAAQAELRPVRGKLPVRPDPASRVGGVRRVRRPAEVERSLVAIRRERADAPATARPGSGASEAARNRASRPEPRLVPPPKRRADAPLPRPPFGREAGGERERPEPPPRFARGRREATAPVAPAPERREPPRASRAPERPAASGAPRATPRERRPAAPELKRPAGPRSRPEARSRSQALSRSRSQPEARSRSQAVSRSRSQPEARSRSQAVSRSRSQPEARSRSQAASRSRSQPEARRPEPPASGRELPGEPANRTYRGRRPGGRSR